MEVFKETKINQLKMIDIIYKKILENKAAIIK